MKNIIRLLIIFAIIMLAKAGMYAQATVDTLMNVSIENLRIDTAGHYSEFDIYLTRTNPAWHLWENATLQMAIANAAGGIDYSAYNVQLVDGASEIITGENTAYYKPEIKLMDDRLMLIVTGPDEYYFAKAFQLAEKLRLCRIRLAAKSGNNGSLPTAVSWKAPSNYYQAIAYKYVENVDGLPEYVVEARDEDQIDVGWTTSFSVAPTIPPVMSVDYFTATYVGNLSVILRYGTSSEYLNKGFIIRRGINPDYRIYNDTVQSYNDIPDEIFTVTVGDYRDPHFANTMTGLYNSYTGKHYDPVPDKITTREVEYVYRLYNQTEGSDELHKLATVPLITPNQVIVLASPVPNPFSERTSIRYIVDDDVYLTCEVFDELGRKVKNLADDVNGLLDRTYVKKGEYYAQFPAPELATQGLYEVRFIAYPINYGTFKIAEAFVKTQLVRD